MAKGVSWGRRMFLAIKVLRGLVGGEGPKAAEVGRSQTRNGCGCPAEDFGLYRNSFFIVAGLF